MLKTISLSPNQLSFGLTIVFVLIALFSFEEYGIAWDEEHQRDIGQVSFDYVFENDQRLETYVDRDHGPVWEMALYGIERLFNLTDSRQIYLMRHIVNHLFFLLGALVLWKLVYRLFESKTIATLGFFILVLAPRIYAHSFFNSKDIPFLVLIIIGLSVFERLWRNRTHAAVIWLGLASGFALNLRLSAAIFVLLVAIALVFQPSVSLTLRKRIESTALFIGTALLSLYATWPYLWGSPWGRIQELFASMISFRHKTDVLFFGELIPSSDLPWTYLPFWFGATTPIVTLILGITGVAALMIRLSTKVRTTWNKHHMGVLIISCALFATPALAVIFLNSTVYDGWRHLYFIYAPFVLLCCYALHRLNEVKGSRVRRSVLGIITIALAYSGTSLITLFPTQQVYFNEFIAKGDQEVRMNFEFDYWGTGFRKGLEYILANDTSQHLSVSSAVACAYQNSFILKEEDRARLHFGAKAMESDYFMANYRWMPKGYDFTYGKKQFFTHKVYNSDLVSVWKMK